MVTLSLEQPALHKDFALPERNQAAILCLLLIAHVPIYLSLKVKSGRKENISFCLTELCFKTKGCE